MYQFLCRRRSVVAKFFLCAVFVVVLYNEWYVYSLQPYLWHNMSCPEEQPMSCTKILFIADPQIQGENEVGPPLSYLFNWDSDRYLRSTFKEALQYFEPNVLVYLGDLMDEGSISTRAQFHRYVKRLSNIFEVPYGIVQIWLPGDNDIGGENEPIRKDKIKEFEIVFDQPSIILLQNLTIFKVNGITNSFIRTSIQDQSYKIVVSHYPLLRRSVFGKQVNNAIQPDIYFCAHEHKSKYMIKDSDWRNIAARTLTPLDPVLQIPRNNDDIYEIYVPTCSYRMGTSTIGYGAAIFNNNNYLLQYTVLWSPQRFPALFVYAFLAMCILVYVFVFSLPKIIFKCSMKVNNGEATIPLLNTS